MDLADVVSFIRPNSEFVISNNDLNTIVFYDNTIMPTNAEIEAGKKAYADKLSTEIAAKADEKAAAQAKLAALGLTTDDLKALGL